MVNPNYKLAEKVRALNGKMSQAKAARLLGVTQSCISSTCKAHNIFWVSQQRDQNGVKNHSYVDGLSRSSISRMTKRVVEQSGRSLFICERCGFKRHIELPRHHKDRDRSNNISENIEVLCVDCHNREHMPERQRDQYGRLLPKI